MACQWFVAARVASCSLARTRRMIPRQERDSLASTETSQSCSWTLNQRWLFFVFLLIESFVIAWSSSSSYLMRLEAGANSIGDAVYGRRTTELPFFLLLVCVCSVVSVGHHIVQWFKFRKKMMEHLLVVYGDAWTGLVSFLVNVACHEYYVGV